MTMIVIYAYASILGAGRPGPVEGVAAGWKSMHEVRSLLRQGAPELLGGALTLIALSVAARVPAGLSRPEFYALHRVSRWLAVTTAFALATLSLISLPVFDGEADQLQSWVGVPLLVVAAATSVLFGESKLDKRVAASKKEDHLQTLQNRRAELQAHPTEFGARFSLLRARVTMGVSRALGVVRRGGRSALGIVRDSVPKRWPSTEWCLVLVMYVPFAVPAIQESIGAVLVVAACAAGSLAVNILAFFLMVQSRKEFVLVVENREYITCSFVNIAIAGLALVLGIMLAVVAGAFAGSGGWIAALLASLSSWVYLLVYAVDGTLVKRFLLRGLDREIAKAQKGRDLLRADLDNVG